MKGDVIALVDTSDRTIYLPLRRPYTLTDYDENGPKHGSTLPLGAVIKVTVTDGALLTDVHRVGRPDAVGEIEYPEYALRATSSVPCRHLSSESCDCEYPCSHRPFFCCDLYDVEHVLQCLGDMSKCPIEETRVAPDPSLDIMPISNLEPFMAKLPFVSWDRYTCGRTWVNVFGWITREDGRSDFVLLHLEPGWETPSFWTSSARYSHEIAILLYGDAEGHADCQRVEWAGLAISHVVHLEQAATIEAPLVREGD